MDESSSGVGVRNESPILFKSIKKLDLIQTPNKHKIDLEDVHKRLLQHLKKGTTLPRNELKGYLDQVQQMKPDDQKNRWLLMKIKGLLSYILKRRTDFRCSIVRGEITIYEKSASQQIANVSDMPEPPEFHSQPANDSIALPSNFLTNNDFLTVEENQNSTKMEVENNYNYSEDLFGTESLHSFSQENYKILKRLTGNTDTSDICGKDEVFKKPEPVNETINKVYKLHDTLEENYNSLVATTQSLRENIDDVRMRDSLDKSKANIFDDLSLTNDQLKEEFDLEHVQTEKWMSDIINNLIHMQVDENNTRCKILMENRESNALNESTSSSRSLPVQTYYSEENFKIIREVCSEFKKNLEDEMKKNKKLEVLRELLNSFN